MSNIRKLAATPASQLKRSGEPVFKTPMSYSPCISGDQVKPSPSKFDIWKKQLGFDDTVLDLETSATGSDLDEDKENVEIEDSNISLVEYNALQRELQERNTQREDLLLQLKTLSEKNHSYKSRLERGENNKKQQIKILHKTHEVNLREKENLIRHLESICEEQESKIEELESSCKGSSLTEHTVPQRLRSLVNEIENLQSRLGEFTHTKLQLSEELEQYQNDLKEERINREKLHAENVMLQENLLSVKAKSNGRTDDQKLMHKIEMENDELQKNTRHLKEEIFKLRSSESTYQNNLEKANQKTMKLQQDCEVYCQKTKQLEKDLKDARNDQSSASEKIQKLTTENQELGQEVRSLNALLLAAQARSPEVVTKVQTVEVISEELELEVKSLQNKIESVQQENMQLGGDIKRLRREIVEQSNLLQQAEIQVNDMKQEKITLHTQHKAEVDKLQQIHDETVQSKLQLQSALDDLSQKNLCLVEQVQGEKLEIERAEKVIEELNFKVGEYICEVKDAKQELSSVKATHMQHIQDLTEAHEQHTVELQQKVNYGHASLEVIRDQYSSLCQEYRELQKSVEQIPTYIKETVQHTTQQVLTGIKDISALNKSLVSKYRKELRLRKKYHNELVELKGNIRVLARVRPVIKEDGCGAMAQSVISFSEEDDVVNVLCKGRNQSFMVDTVLQPNSSQHQVYREVESLVTSCIDGYNVCIFAYGQTGSGKTYTMEGTTSDPGINQRALTQLFTETENRETESRFTITVSVLEIYNESIRDLLSDSSQKLEVKMQSDGGLYVPGLRKVQVKTISEMNQVFMTGQENRVTAATNMNEHSSRSHALLCIDVIGQNITTGTKTIGKLNLVDLAGSERVSKSGADGPRLKEAQAINKSLASLGDVIHSLRKKQSHVPYRNSKLTYLLQDSLSGDSKTLMIVQVSPVERNVGETLASLSFAQRVRLVELGQATKKTENAEIADLKEKIAEYEELLNIGSKQAGSKPPLKIARKK